MFVTVTKINDEKTALVNPVICNKYGKLHVAIRSLNYVVGYHNVPTPLEIFYTTFDDERGDASNYIIPPGFYSIKELIKTIKDLVPNITIQLSEKTGIVTLTVKGTNGALDLFNGLNEILGLDETTITGTYVGDRPAYLPNPPKLFYIYLDQLSSSNSVDGAPSTLLAVIPASTVARDVFGIDFPCPIYKKLQVGDIHQLNLRVMNERGEKVDNNTKPFIVTLEIRDA